MARLVLAMSGGVDSSVAAWLLQRQGHEVVGVFMRHGMSADDACPPSAAPATPAKQGCCSAADAADARRVADVLSIPFYALNFEDDFQRIVDYFVGEYAACRTPNPCIVCNTRLKFGKLFHYADSIGADGVATGHYARIVPPDAATDGAGGRSGDAHLPDPVADRPPNFGDAWPALCRGRDAAKDQSYVLFGLQRARLARLWLPVGDYRKDEIRAMAANLGLRVAEKPDSQEICFVPDHDHARLVRQRRCGTDTSGEIVTTAGDVVGRHDGIERYTVGQRKGLGVAFGDRRYVVRLERHSRRVVVGTLAELACWELTASAANWLIDPPAESLRCEVKIRYRSRPAAATVDPIGPDRFRVRFDAPCTGVAPGQAAVCYRGSRVLGGGWIDDMPLS